MDYKNGYKVVYEFAANGERTFYAATTSTYPNRDKDGNITDTKLASFVDADYVGKTIYEHEGQFYVANTADAKFDADGKPTGTLLEGFEAILGEAPVNSTPAYAEAITANGDTYGDITINGNTVTINAVGEVKWLKSAWGTYGNWVGFRINVPEGVDATKAIYTRPNGKASPLSDVLDTGKNYASVYSDMAKYGNTATYYLDWTGDGMNDLTVTIDVSNATLASAPANEE
jgi:hypothetical protein